MSTMYLGKGKGADVLESFGMYFETSKPMGKGIVTFLDGALKFGTATDAENGRAATNAL